MPEPERPQTAKSALARGCTRPGWLPPETSPRHPGQVATTRWHDLSSRSRRLIIIGRTLEGLLKAAALVDLVRQPPHYVRGSKPGWAAAIVIINSFGAVPIAYFAFGKRRR
jgi:hypothetical protein